jgi:hypothetical protein
VAFELVIAPVLGLNVMISDWVLLASGLTVTVTGEELLGAKVESPS